MVLYTGVGLLKYLYQTNIYLIILMYIHDLVKRNIMSRYTVCSVMLCTCATCLMYLLDAVFTYIILVLPRGLVSGPANPLN